jgi:hypothetical protein
MNNISVVRRSKSINWKKFGHSGNSWVQYVYTPKIFLASNIRFDFIANHWDRKNPFRGVQYS